MGGEVLELLNERAARLEQEALQKGRREGRLEGQREGRLEGQREGRREGQEQGLKLGREQAVEAMSAELRSMGLDEESIAKAVAAALAGREQPMPEEG